MIAPVDPAGEYKALKKRIDAAVREVLASGQFIGGVHVEGFEQEFAAFLGAAHAVGVANGTDALEVALAACGIGTGDNVAVPAFTFAATVEAVVRVGATPIIYDITESDFSIDVHAVGESIRAGQSIAAVIPVHLYGHPADMEGLLALQSEHGFKIVEDAAQSHGARIQIGGERKRVGRLGTFGCFSFYPTKNLGAAGDAGAIVTNDEALAARARLIANHGDAAKYTHVLPDGRNSRLDAIQAAILRIKLEHLDEWNSSRRRIAARYTQALDGVDARLPSERPGAESVFHQYALRIANRDQVLAKLREQGIAAGVHYPIAIPDQEGFADYADDHAQYPTARRAADEVLCLPIYPLMKDSDVETVIEAITALLA